MTKEQFKKLEYFQNEEGINYTNFIDTIDGSTKLEDYSSFTDLLNDLSHELKAGFLVDYTGGEDAYYQISTKIADLIISNYFIDTKEMCYWLSENNQLEGLYDLCMKLKDDTAKHKNKIIQTIKEL